MYPDLSYFLHDLFPSLFNRDGGFSVVKTFGLMLAFAFLASAYTLTLEFLRKESEGILKPKPRKIVVGAQASVIDLLVNGLVGFFVGFKFLHAFNNFTKFQEDAAGIIFSSQGNKIGGIVGAILFTVYHWWAAKKDALPQPQEKVVNIYPHDRVGDITIVAAISGIIGAKLFSVLENFERFLLDPIGEFFSGSGLTMYGGLILAFFVVFIYIKRLGIPPLEMMDCAGLAVTVGYGVGRLGCHFSGDGDWGIVNTAPKPSWMSFLPDWLWSYNYPNNVLNEGSPIEQCANHYCSQLIPGVFPTPLYESILCLAMLVILWNLRTRIKIPGLLFFIYLILNGLERFSIEGIRVNPRYDMFGFHQLSQAQYIALGLILIGILGGAIIYLLRNKIAKT